MQSSIRSTLSAVVLAGCFAFLTTGCGSDATGPDGSGDGFAEATVTDNPNSTAPSVVGPVLHIAGSSESATYTGTITGNLSVAISANGQTWYELGAPNGITIQAQNTGSATTVHGETTVPAGTYARVRLTMQDAKATIHSGAVIGGITLTTDVDVMVAGGNQIVIEKQIETFTVSADATLRTEIAFDLNSELWVTEENVEQEEASEEDVENASEAKAMSSERDTVQ